MNMNAEKPSVSTVRDLPHVWVGCELLDGGDCQYIKRWKRQGMPWAEYWPAREHSLLVRLAEAEARHVVEVIGIDARRNEVRTRDAGISLDRFDCRVETRGEAEPHPHPFFDVTELLKLMRWTLVALEEIHTLGLVHCDLSPGNVCLPLLCRSDGWRCLDYSRLRLIDFAFALHRDLPLKHPLPVDTAAPELYCLPPFFRAAVVRDQQEGRAVHAQRAIDPGIDLYSLGMIAQTWYRAGFRPHARIPATTVEALFRRLNRHGRERGWYTWRRPGCRQLRETIDRLLERTRTDPSRSADFRFLAAEARPAEVATAVTPLLTRVRAAAREVVDPVPVADAIALQQERRRAAGGEAMHAPASMPRERRRASPHRPPVAASEPRGGGWRRTLSPLLASVLGGVLFFAQPGGHPPPSAPASAARHVVEVERWVNALSAPDVRRRGEAAEALVRLAGTGREAGVLAEQVTVRFVGLLSTSASNPHAAAQHAAAWFALSAIAEQAGELPIAAVARRAMEDYERYTEVLHGRFARLIYDRPAQAREPEWNDYVLRLATLANAGSARGALVLGLIESSHGRYAEAFRYMRMALLRGEDRKAVSDEIGRLLQRLVDSEHRQALAAVVTEVEEMAEQRYPRWQIWAARVNDVLGERDKAAAWYRRVRDNSAAGRAEKDYARSAMARLSLGT